MLVQEVEEDDSFDDIYAAAGMAFANSRATKAQRERELDGLEEDLPTAQAALATAKSEGQNVVQAATQRAQQMQADAEGEVKRIQDAIATKQAQIAKAENSDVEKASALIAVLQSYVATHSG